MFNECFGGFGLSDAGMRRLAELGNAEGLAYVSCPPPSTGLKLLDHSWHDLRTTPRHDAALVQVVQELGTRASGRFAHLAIQEIEGNKYRIHKYDGAETVQEPKDLEWIEVSP